MKKQTAQTHKALNPEQLNQVVAHSPDDLQPSWFDRVTGWLYAGWKFSRPHTIIGTSLSVWGLYLITAATVAQTL